jgi:glycyl-tRNA synthetase
MGLGRVFLAVLSEAYQEEILENGETRKILKLKPFLSPIKISILPLTKKDGLPEIAKTIYEKLSNSYNISYSETASIGKRYRKADEIGTPYCITVDYDSKENDTVTVRDRDSMNQEIIKISDIDKYFKEKLS